MLTHPAVSVESTETPRNQSPERNDEVFDSPTLSLSTVGGQHNESFLDCLVLRVRGEIDMLTASKLDEVVRNQGSRAKHTVIDLSEVSFLDTSGLGVLIAASREMPIALVAQPGAALKPITITGADRELLIRSTVAEATAAVTEDEMLVPAA